MPLNEYIPYTYSKWHSHVACHVYMQILPPSKRWRLHSRTQISPCGVREVLCENPSIWVSTHIADIVMLFSLKGQNSGDECEFAGGCRLKTIQKENRY